MTPRSPKAGRPPSSWRPVRLRIAGGETLLTGQPARRIVHADRAGEIDRIQDLTGAGRCPPHPANGQSMLEKTFKPRLYVGRNIVERTS